MSQAESLSNYLLGKTICRIERVVDQVRLYLNDDFCLYINCLMRLFEHDVLIASKNDMFTPGDYEVSTSWDNFDWYNDASLFDKCVDRFFELNPNAIQVSDIRVAPCGDIIITNCEGIRVEALMSSLRNDIQWELVSIVNGKPETIIERYPG